MRWPTTKPGIQYTALERAVAFTLDILVCSIGRLQINLPSEASNSICPQRAWSLHPKWQFHRWSLNPRHSQRLTTLRDQSYCSCVSVFLRVKKHWLHLWQNLKGTNVQSNSWCIFQINRFLKKALHDTDTTHGYSYIHTSSTVIFWFTAFFIGNLVQTWQHDPVLYDTEAGNCKRPVRVTITSTCRHFVTRASVHLDQIKAEEQTQSTSDLRKTWKLCSRIHFLFTRRNHFDHLAVALPQVSMQATDINTKVKTQRSSWDLRPCKVTTTQSPCRKEEKETSKKKKTDR